LEGIISAKISSVHGQEFTGAVIAMDCFATLFGSPKTPMYLARTRKLCPSNFSEGIPAGAFISATTYGTYLQHRVLYIRKSRYFGIQVLDRISLACEFDNPYVDVQS
jgi:hypothetical protein